MTSILAIVALLVRRSHGWNWADPAIGVVGADATDLSAEIREALETDTDRIAGLHVWKVGPGTGYRTDTSASEAR